MRSLVLLEALVVFLGACLPSSLAGVLPDYGRRSVERFQEQRRALQEEAAQALNGQKDDVLRSKNVAEYMINELKRKAPHGEGVTDLKESLKRTGDRDNRYNWFCYFFPHYCYGCASHEFECSDGTCIPGYWECDRWNDCGDASDEVNCECATDEFTCANGRCIPDYWQCDHDNDCWDYSDEEGCFAYSTTSQPETMDMTTAPPPMCGWDNWSEWSECNTGCGAGQRHRTRSCLCTDTSLCDGESTEYEMCELATCMPEADSGCGSRHPQGSIQRIVGGNDAVRGAWPWYAQLYFNGRFSCGGTLVEDRFIISAAHCFEGSSRMNPTNWRVILGKYRENDDSGDEHESGVSEVIVHASYDSDTVDHDIAILVLSNPPAQPEAGTNPVINSACVDTAASVDESLVCFIAGFGSTSEGGDVSSVLKEAEVPIVDRSRCNHPSSYNGGVTQNMLCAGFFEGGIDSCQGDSGGPLVCSRRSRDDATGSEVERWYLTGITSWGNGCARPNFPGVYTNVARYGQWIDNIIASRGSTNSP
ncbi:transmembrane protease serine 6-like [Acanthaster planci]|uniref:Transmembrane protease serine 6-like n=1 Tax=Acanthaster planci TaxID=133434 RepID=A0A8B7YAC4_ACAPL|nr:transmembrane protease serine 6-like [Acanthaster planci]